MEKQLYKLFYELEDTHWWFVSTRTYFIKTIARYLPRTSPTILDAGCGTGAIMKELDKLGTVHGIDVSRRALTYARKRGLHNLAQGSLTNLPFENKHFDVIVALDVIEHVKEDGKAISEMFRVLKSNGCLLMAVPAFSLLWSTHDKLNHHYRRYTHTKLIQLLQSHHFSIVRYHYFGITTFLPLLTMSLLERWRLVSSWSFFKPVNPYVNRFLTSMFTLDLYLCSVLKPPFGTSIFLVAEKRRA